MPAKKPDHEKHPRSRDVNADNRIKKIKKEAFITDFLAGNIHTDNVTELCRKYEVDVVPQTIRMWLQEAVEVRNQCVVDNNRKFQLKISPEEQKEWDKTTQTLKSQKNKLEKELKQLEDTFSVIHDLVMGLQDSEDEIPAREISSLLRSYINFQTVRSKLIKDYLQISKSYEDHTNLSIERDRVKALFTQEASEIGKRRGQASGDDEKSESGDTSDAFDI